MMAKENKAVYSPGELSRVREKLGEIDESEAKRMANVLGGQVGYERTEEQEKARHKPRTRHERVDVKIGSQQSNRSSRHWTEEPDEINGRPDRKQKRRKNANRQNPDDDPAVNLKSGYFDRVKMDKYAGQSQFEIKSSGQVLFSVLTVFGDIPDYVNPVFVTKRMMEYYRQLEILVISTRNMFPRNNPRRNDRIKKTAPLVFAILDTIRYWNIEKISSELARLQARPKSIKVEDFYEILRMIYRPLFVLEKLDMDTHIRASYKILYKILYIENPMEAQVKYQDLIRSALGAFSDVRRDIHFLMYPLLMKAVSARFVNYENFFTERRNRIMAFLKAAESDQIDAGEINSQVKVELDDVNAADDKPTELIEEEETEITPEEQAKRNAAEAEKKALDRGLQTLEVLFPNAGWDRLSTYPDLYPYFVDTFDLRRGFVNIAPTDPLQQIFILMRIIEEFFFGLRFVTFGTVSGSEGTPENIGDVLTEIINNWNYFIVNSFEKVYLPRLSEYVRLAEGSPENWNSPYTKKTVSDLHWTKRLYYLPYYKFESLAPPPFQKKDITPIYPEIKRLRKYLSAVGAGIEMGNRNGGADRMAHCNGIENPWSPYEFQVPNPLSQRLDALLAPKNKTNASLVFFTLAAATVLDYLVNNEDSWAYGSRPGPLFRSVDGEGVTPLTGIDTRIDAEALFKASIRKRQKPE